MGPLIGHPGGLGACGVSGKMDDLVPAMGSGPARGAASGSLPRVAGRGWSPLGMAKSMGEILPRALPPKSGQDVIRPSKQEYFLLLALAARTRADCLGRMVGAVVVREDRVISTGYNGTPIGMPNCSEGGCHRCANRESEADPAGRGYDLCICVHAGTCQPL